jgi:hypothetical protein
MATPNKLQGTTPEQVCDLLNKHKSPTLNDTAIPLVSQALGVHPSALRRYIHERGIRRECVYVCPPEGEPQS